MSANSRMVRREEGWNDLEEMSANSRRVRRDEGWNDLEKMSANSRRVTRDEGCGSQCLRNGFSRFTARCQQKRRAKEDL